MKKETNEQSEETQENARKPRRPDYRGRNVAVWQNENDKHKWLSIRIEGMDEKFIAFENEQ
jgi:hypothetical protein